MYKNTAKLSRYLTAKYFPLYKFHAFLGVWTKRGLGHGLPYGLPYGLAVVDFLELVSALL